MGVIVHHDSRGNALLIRSTRRISYPSSGAANQSDRTVTSRLEVTQAEQLKEVSYVKTLCSGIKSNITCARLREVMIEFFFACSQCLEKSSRLECLQEASSVHPNLERKFI